MKFEKLIQWLKKLLEEESAFLLSIIAIIVLVLETLSSLGVWELPGFKNQLTEITLTFLLIFALGVVSQQRLHSVQLSDLGKKIVEQADLSVKLKQIGIANLWGKDKESVERRREILVGAKSLSIVSVSAYTWIYANSDILSELIHMKGCIIRILLATPESDFVMLREEREGESRRGSISSEINSSIGFLREIIKNKTGSSKPNSSKSRGMIEVRFCKGDIPGRVEIINDAIIHWTPHILPARSSFMPSFEILNNSNSSTAKLLLDYFEMLWGESKMSTVLIWPEQKSVVADKVK